MAVADRLNFRQAADHLHVTQPALSAQIKDLEAELGLRLLERNTQSVRLTEAGAVFRERARAVLASVTEAVTAARDAAAGRRGRLLVGNISAFSAGFMSPNLEVFREKFPDIEVTLVPLGMGRHIPALASGEIQVGFTMGRRELFPASVHSRPLLRSPIRVLVGRTHPLARRRAISLKELAGETFFAIAYGPTHSSLMETQVRQLFQARGIELRSVKHVDGFEAILTLLISGLGFTLMPEIATASLPAPIVSKPIADRGSDLIGELSVLCRAGESSLVVRSFVASLLRWSRDYSRRHRLRAR